MASAIAVLGSGLEQIYPSFLSSSQQEHVKETRVFLFSEHLPLAALARHFPQRNRIISGLGSSSLNWQTGIKIGSLSLPIMLYNKAKLFVLPSYWVIHFEKEIIS